LSLKRNHDSIAYLSLLHFSPPTRNGYKLESWGSEDHKERTNLMKYSDDEREQFALAQQRSRNNDLPGTIAILKRLVAGKPRAAMFNATLANTLKAVGDITPAIEHFREAVKLIPNSELYSLGLFHILWEQGRRDEAFDEMKRFTANADSIDYRTIVAEMNA
jgi:predicted Zn-dependent protease